MELQLQRLYKKLNLQTRLEEHIKYLLIIYPLPFGMELNKILILVITLELELLPTISGNKLAFQLEHGPMETTMMDFNIILLSLDFQLIKQFLKLQSPQIIYLEDRTMLLSMLKFG